MTRNTLSFSRALRVVLMTACFMLGAFFFAGNAQAASYETLLVSQSGSGTITMEPGEVQEVQATFLNIGSTTWANDGAGYLSVYTYDPKYRRSDFDPGTWLGPEQVKRIREVTVAPGAQASVVFELHAPATEGLYTETFALASEDTAWVNGGELTFTIEVTSDVQEVVTGDEASGYDAQVVVQTANELRVKAGVPILFTLGVKNTGTKAWSDYALHHGGEVQMAAAGVDFAHPSWSGTRVAYATDAVAPGETAVMTFAMTAPDVNGTHTASFDLQVGSEVIEDVFELPVTVTGGASEATYDKDDEEEEDNVEVEDGVVLGTIEEVPMLRVGLLTVDEETDNVISITSYESDFELRDVQENLLAKIDKGDVVTAYYSDGRYYFDAGRGLEKSTYGLRFVPDVENAIMTITNFDYRVSRNGSSAYNTYHNILELRYNDYKDRTWVINELPMDYYLNGLAETSNVSPQEYQKSLVTAARTYAYYHYTHGTKRGKEFMHLVAYADDQVYRGAERAQQSPNVVKAVEATKGVVVTYDGDLAITPYFSRSDGRTRDWSEVWGGVIPWAKSVSVPWDIGKTLWGHGVGMSAQGALAMANEDYDWQEILKYFYTDIGLEKRWE